MSFFSLKTVRRPLTRRARLVGILAGAACAAIAAGASGPAAAEAPGEIPNLASSSSFAWTPLTINGGIARYGTGWFDPPAGLRGPIKQHPDYPLRGNETGRPTPALGNYKDPILKPWAACKRTSMQRMGSSSPPYAGRCSPLARDQTPAIVPAAPVWLSDSSTERRYSNTPTASR